MSKDTYIYLVIFGMFIVSFIPRIAPLLIFSKYKMSKDLESFISYFPVSILTGLVIKELFFIKGNLVLDLSNPNIIPAIVTFLIAVKFKSIALTIITGIVSFIVYGFVF